MKIDGVNTELPRSTPSWTTRSSVFGIRKHRRYTTVKTSKCLSFSTPLYRWKWIKSFLHSLSDLRIHLETVSPPRWRLSGINPVTVYFILQLRRCLSGVVPFRISSVPLSWWWLWGFDISMVLRCGRTFLTSYPIRVVSICPFRRTSKHQGYGCRHTGPLFSNKTSEF